MKIQNPDFSKSDVRILDIHGQPSYHGRVEFRVGGRWGTVNRASDTNDLFARMVCKTLNYSDGHL